MSVSTSTYVTTRVHTATHLTDVILGTIASILGDLRLDTSSLSVTWTTDESAIKAWIAEESLSAVILECTQPDGTVDPVIEFPVAYTRTGSGNAEFTASRARMARFLAKVQRVPAATTYRLVCTFRSPRTPQPGWGQTTRARTDGLRALSYGTMATGPYATAGMRYLRG